MGLRRSVAAAFVCALGAAACAQVLGFEDFATGVLDAGAGGDATSDATVGDGAPPDGALPDGALADGALPDGTLPDSGCGDTRSSPDNCGACGHGCLGGDCEGGLCQPIVLSSPNEGGVGSPGRLSVDDAGLVVFDNTQGLTAIAKSPQGFAQHNLASASAVDAVQIASDGQYVFATSTSFEIVRCSEQTGCSSTRTVLVDGGSASPVQLTLVGDTLFFASASSQNGPVGRVSTSGQGPTLLTNDVLAYVLGGDRRHVYYGASGTTNIVTVPVDGGTDASTTLNVAFEVSAMAALTAFDAGVAALYADQQLGQQRVLIVLRDDAGALVAPAIVVDAGGTNPDRIVSDSSRLYWAFQNGVDGTSSGAIFSCTLPACADVTVVVPPSGAQQPIEIAIDDRAIYWIASATNEIRKVAKP